MRLFSGGTQSKHKDNLCVKSLVGSLLWYKLNTGTPWIKALNRATWVGLRSRLKLFSKAKFVGRMWEHNIECTLFSLLQVELCLECIEWAKSEKRTFLRQALEVCTYISTGFRSLGIRQIMGVSNTIRLKVFSATLYYPGTQSLLLVTFALVEVWRYIC